MRQAEELCACAGCRATPSLRLAAALARRLPGGSPVWAPGAPSEQSLGAPGAPSGLTQAKVALEYTLLLGIDQQILVSFNISSLPLSLNVLTEMRSM